MWNESKLVGFLFEVNCLLDFYESVSISLDQFREEFVPESQASWWSFKSMVRRKLKQLIRQLNLSLIIFIRNNNVIFKKQEVMP